MTQKMLDRVIGVLINQGITFLGLLIIFKMTAFAASGKEINDKIDSKVDKEVYDKDWVSHEKQHDKDYENWLYVRGRLDDIYNKLEK